MPAKKCDKGWGCGKTCISKTDRCPLTGEEEKTSLTKVSKIIKVTSASPQAKTFSDAELADKAKNSDTILNSKKERRASIAGKPNEKELKKQLIAEEDEAYAIVMI